PYWQRVPHRLIHLAGARSGVQVAIKGSDGDGALADQAHGALAVELRATAAFSARHRLRLGREGFRGLPLPPGRCGKSPVRRSNVWVARLPDVMVELEAGFRITTVGGDIRWSTTRSRTSRKAATSRRGRRIRRPSPRAAIPRGCRRRRPRK